MKTLKEVQQIVGLDRRAIQEYEKKNLAIKPSHTNKYGHLLYDEPEIERLWQLRFYKELGYNIPEIATIMRSKNYDLQKELESVIDSLKEKRDNLDNLIAIAEVMKTTGASLNTMRHSVDLGEEINADAWFALFGKAISMSNSINDDFFNFEVITEELFNDTLDILELILADCDMGKAPSSEAVQDKMKQIHNRAENVLSESVIPFQCISIYLEPEGELVRELLSEVKSEHIAYIREVLNVYCDSQRENLADQKFEKALNHIEVLGRQKYTTNSIEVQEEVRKIHEFFREIPLLSPAGAIGMLKNIGSLAGSDTYKKHLDKGAKRGIAWFISRAIELYCMGHQAELK